MKPIFIIGIAMYYVILTLLFSPSLGSPLATGIYGTPPDITTKVTAIAVINPYGLGSGEECTLNTDCLSNVCDASGWFGTGVHTCKASTGINGIGEFFANIGKFITSLFQLFGLLFLGIGLPFGCPAFFQIIFTLIQLMIFIIFITSFMP